MKRDEENEEETVDVQRALRACKTTDYMRKLSQLGPNDPKTVLGIGELACAMYEGMPHVQNLAEKLARTHGNAGALTFFDMMGEDVQNFWMTIAAMLIQHARCWKGNEGSGCVLDPEEAARLEKLRRVDPTDEKTWPSGDAEANLGCATTSDLLGELKARAELAGYADFWRRGMTTKEVIEDLLDRVLLSGTANYRTVDR